MAEGKILIIAVYFVIFLVLVLVRDAVFGNGRAQFEDAVNSYFACEAVGFVPGKCSRESFEQILYPLLCVNIAFYLANLFLPAVILLYLVNCSKVAKCIKKQKIKALKVLSTTPSSSSTTETSNL